MPETDASRPQGLTVPRVDSWDRNQLFISSAILIIIIINERDENKTRENEGANTLDLGARALSLIDYVHRELHHFPSVG